jgi:hypothetical protein
MWRSRDKSKMGIQTTHLQIEKSIKSKSEPSVSDQLAIVLSQLSKLTGVVDELKNKEHHPVINNYHTSGGVEEPPKVKSKPGRVFIPSVSTDGMTVSASKPQKRSRKINISQNVDQLIKMEKQGNQDD